MNDRSTNRVGAPGDATAPAMQDMDGLHGVESGSVGAQVPADVCSPAATADRGHVTQGHLYDFNGRAVIALKSGSRVPVEYVEPLTVFADAVDLVPLAMRYFGRDVTR